VSGETTTRLSDLVLLCANSLKLREQAGITTTTKVIDTPVKETDPLADMAAVLGEPPRMKTQDLLQRLVRSTWARRPVVNGRTC
jgi:S-DNA-T family DNA segregation ATPase FtsK/SpoIIIE